MVASSECGQHPLCVDLRGGRQNLGWERNISTHHTFGFRDGVRTTGPGEAETVGKRRKGHRLLNDICAILRVHPRGGHAGPEHPRQGGLGGGDVGRD